MLTVTSDCRFETSITDTFVADRRSQKDTNAQRETLPSDAEIARRVAAIRGGWSEDECVERRIEAELRFADLLDTLLVCESEVDAA